MRIGIDAGGTFTDFIVLDDSGHIETFKLRSNPANPASVILAGIEHAARGRRVEIIHGSTVATNALLERKGARTAFITTAGFEDLLEIGRQNRAQLYNLMPGPKRLLVPPDLCFGADERTLYDGTILRKPESANLQALVKRLRKAAVDSVAVCLLHSYQNDANEKQVAEALGPEWFVSLSSDVCPEFREYERASTTALNSYVGPLMQRYLSELEAATRHPISIMQSNGGLISAAEARSHAVRTILSGPAGGVVGAVEAAASAGFRKVLGFDMGGTSTDVSLSQGRPRETTEAFVDGLPIRIPMLDIHTVGAGGGSIARVDEGGLLRVGPESAGADPGPACYGKGDLPTVTDAHVALGRIAADQLAGGTMALDVDRASAAVDRVATALNIDRTAAAAGIVRVANANMERAIRAVSVEKGYDPREFALVAFGGCGGLHACEIAAELGLRTVLVPQFAGALSALGMLMADRVRDYSAGVLNRKDIETRFKVLEKQARREMRAATLTRFADYRYAGQSYEITLPWGDDFHAAHKAMYGYNDASRSVETVTIRVRATLPVEKPKFPKIRRASQTIAKRRIYTGGKWADVPVMNRQAMPIAFLKGPLLIVDYGSTTLVPPAWSAKVDTSGCLILKGA